MSAPTEMELKRPEPEPDPAWACKVPGCTEPIPADVEDQPHCESCHVPVCEKHVVTRAHVHLCQQCYGKERFVMLSVAVEMKEQYRRIWLGYNFESEAGTFDPNNVQSACERWMKEIGEVL